ncbi:MULTISPECIES: tetratricopeptide repeat protein [unclassified Halomonas]|uniref:tetratricopeptide repeat protein n=1 Tax=unclassified Halomonas TaxID=2609666 RepID=UPI000D3C899C|nr:MULTISPECIES: tetratricopeptide repeat protein [unclassified Halomonas]MBR9878320.1 sel1 repeat family protein [Gammaproteobacteria bacterium]|tara:strand:+ start:467 stop:1390 length:924 start_codon:yes stop_codon:yes gene_type:complete
MKKNRVFLVFFVFLTLSACDKQDVSGEEERFVSMEGDSVIYNKNGDAFFLTKYYRNNDIDCFGSPRDVDKQFCVYLVGRSYLENIPGVDVEVNPSLARRKLIDAWRLGVVDAGFYLYEAYLHGDSGIISLELAGDYLKASANLGFLRSEQKLGFLYSGYSPKGVVNEEFSKAVFWFTRAAEKGDKVSAVSLAWIYYEGLGVEQSDDMTFKWLLEAESLPYGNEFEGFSGLAKAYEEGIGTEVDLVQAYKYYDLLSPGRSQERARIEAQMTSEQIREAIRLSRQWQEEHNIFVPSYYGLEYQEDGSFQ